MTSAIEDRVATTLRHIATGVGQETPPWPPVRQVHHSASKHERHRHAPFWPLALVGAFVAASLVVAVAVLGRAGGHDVPSTSPSLAAGPIPSFTDPPVTAEPETTSVSAAEGAAVYTFVPLVDLDAPGEATRLEDYDAALADGPIVGPDGKTYGNEPPGSDGTPGDSPDFVGVSDPWQPGTPIVGFLSVAERWAPPDPSGGSDHEPVTVYGFGGDVVLGHLDLQLVDGGPAYTTVFVPAS